MNFWKHIISLSFKCTSIKSIILSGVVCFSSLAQHQFKKITILTAPIGNPRQEQGHKMVTQSLIRGLTQLSIPFNHNPSNETEVGDVVIVLANIQALGQSIGLKRKRPNMLLFAGPNLMMWPTDDHGILLLSEIDKVVVPSKTTRHMYAEIAPILNDRLLIWYAGVNPQQWKPTSNKKTKDVLVYWKNQSEGPSLKNSVVTLLQEYGWKPIVLEYGKYNPTQYKTTLNSAEFSVFLSRSESQGIALAEAWSMNVPTITWNPKERTARGRVYSAVSSCPYLTLQTGLDWKNLDQFKNILNSIDETLKTFSPREWLLENMSDAKSAQLLVDLINETLQERACTE